MAAKPETVVERDGNFPLAGGVWGKVQIALVLRIVKVDGRRNDAAVDSQGAGDAFHCARGSEQMAGHGLGGRDRETFCVVTEDGLQCANFAQVTYWG